VPENVRDGVLIASHKTGQDRVSTAEVCVLRLAIELPSLVDGIDNRVERAYTGWPDRMYVIGTDGRVKYMSAPGPYGFVTAELEQAVAHVVASASPSAMTLQ
jgi:hypothetical protein